LTDRKEQYRVCHGYVAARGGPRYSGSQKKPEAGTEVAAYQKGTGDWFIPATPLGSRKEMICARRPPIDTCGGIALALSSPVHERSTSSPTLAGSFGAAR